MARKSGTPAALAKKHQTKGGRPAVLSQERILDIARQIPARDLSMPTLARQLGVSATALYRHFESRDVLLAALEGRLAEEFEFRPADPAHWREWLVDAAMALYRFLVDNPVILVAPSWVHFASTGSRLLEAAHATLEGAGFDESSAAEAWGVVSGHAYLSARLLHDASAPIDPAALRVLKAALRDSDANEGPSWQAVVKRRGSIPPTELLAQSLRWLTSVLPEPRK